MQRHREVCAALTFSWRQIFFYLLCVAALILGFLRDYKIAYTVLTFALCGFYGAVIFFRLVSVLLGLVRSSEHRVVTQEVQSIANEDLPVYTILVPMYKEPEVAQKIIHAIAALDYPLDKLDVKLLLEEDDAETRNKIEEFRDALPPCVELVIAPCVPKGQPRTKPRACNWGLERARGKYLVIYDAEDQPEPDQLKKAVIAFRRLAAQGKTGVVCLQAKLNYFNARQNALTRFFTLEYTNWFDIFLPGLHAVRSPIPLGGTSNHFQTDVLKELGGWDPFNVTEDCDLGIRLTRQGYSTEILDSTTWEEGNSQVGNWIRQRSRWMKGYFQTHLVHSRESVLPMLGLATIFALFYGVYNEDSRMTESLKSWVRTLKTICGILCLFSASCALYSFALRHWGIRRTRQLGLWKALTFRFTVGGLSTMLLLNLVFWLMTSMYLLHEPIAARIPNFLGNVRVDETTTLREALRGWKLYYTNVTDEGHAGATVWNTLSGYLGKTLSARDVQDRFAAIDTWSLISQLFYPVAAMLFVANFIFVLLGLVSCHKRRMWDLFPFALLMPFYWILISVAAINGFQQLFTNPFYWEKTRHGLSDSQHQPPGSMEK